MRITFSNCIRHYRAYDHYIKQPKSMCENRLNQTLAKIPPVIKCLNRHSNRPIFRKYTHRSIV